MKHITVYAHEIPANGGKEWTYETNDIPLNAICVGEVMTFTDHPAWFNVNIKGLSRTSVTIGVQNTYKSTLSTTIDIYLSFTI